MFVWAHFLGAFFKTLILRDWKITWTLLVIWEIVEYSCQHILPNFAECWWDHWLLDVFGFNLLGMLAGLVVSRKLSSKVVGACVSYPVGQAIPYLHCVLVLVYHVSLCKSLLLMRLLQGDLAVVTCAVARSSASPLSARTHSVCLRAPWKCFNGLLFAQCLSTIGLALQHTAVCLLRAR